MPPVLRTKHTAKRPKTTNTTKPTKNTTKRKPNTVRTETAPPTQPAFKFINKDAQDRFVESKAFKVVMERRFDVINLGKYTEFESMLQARNWELLNNMVFNTSNKTVTLEFYANARFTPTMYQSFVRGKTIDYSPDAINQLLGLTAPEECGVKRRRAAVKDMMEDDFDGLLSMLCRPGTTWRKARMLAKADFMPSPKAWASFVVQTLEGTSCTSEIPLKRILTIDAILSGEDINVGELIANNIREIALSKLKSVAHSSLICWLCEEAQVEEYRADIDAPTMKAITERTMDAFVTEYEEFLRGGGQREEQDQQGPAQPQPPSQTYPGEGSSQQPAYPPLHPMLLKYMFTSANWMNETSDQLYVNRPRFSQEFAAEAHVHRRPPTGSYERFEGNRENMVQYFDEQRGRAASREQEIAADFDETERRNAAHFMEEMNASDPPHTWFSEQELQEMGRDLP